jgi:D-alanine-D-alanine ligase
MRVIILHNAVDSDAPAADRDVLVQAELVGQALGQLGYTWETLPCTLDLESARRQLLELHPDVVFNLVESLGGSDGLNFLAPALMDTLGIPYTGVPATAMFVANHKLLAKQRLRETGLPTPDWRTEKEDHGSFATGREESWIIKTIAEHASFGLDEHSVGLFADEESLMQRLDEVSRQLGRACFAERFIEGREFNLSVLAGEKGPEVLPPAEIDFSAFPAGKPRVVGHRAKWEQETFEFNATPRRFTFDPADAPLLAELRQIAADCWQKFGLRGYARVDFRVDQAGRPWVLEINANPCLSPDAGFFAAVGQAGLDGQQLVARILADALEP